MSLTGSGQYRGGQHDRRRRLLTDELSHSSRWPASRAACDSSQLPQKISHYGNAAFLDEQLRLTDLIPRHPIALVLMFFLGVATLAGLEAAYDWMLRHGAEANAGAASIAALDLHIKGSLGNWFCVATSLAASMAAALIYSVRRHRIDDYQGRYRVWLWAAVCCFLMATDQAASLHDAFQLLMINLTGSRLLGDGTIWWVSFYTVLFAAIGSRLLIDMRPNWLAIVAFVLAGVGYGWATAMQLGWMCLETGRQEVMVRVGIKMAANLFLLSAMTLQARHVLMDAEGLLPVREPNAERSDADADEAPGDSRISTGDDAWVKIDSPHGTPQPALRRTSATATANVAGNSAAATAAPTPIPSVERKLTKAERRALKARLLREREERMR